MPKICPVITRPVLTQDGLSDTLEVECYEKKCALWVVSGDGSCGICGLIYRPNYNV